MTRLPRPGYAFGYGASRRASSATANPLERACSSCVSTGRGLASLLWPSRPHSRHSPHGWDEADAVE